jgi:hypothetical protein
MSTFFELESWSESAAAFYQPSSSASCGDTHLNGSIRLLRKLLSILLLVVFGLPVVSPLFALSTTGGTRLPACCRRDGKHHCMASTVDGGSLTRSGAQFSAAAEKCPYCPSVVSIRHNERLAVPVGDAVFASLVGHPSAVAQTESMRRISLDRSRQKRGPPVLSLLA